MNSKHELEEAVRRNPSAVKQAQEILRKHMRVNGGKQAAAAEPAPSPEIDIAEITMPAPSETPEPPAPQVEVGGNLTEDRLAQAFEKQYKGQLLYDHHRARWYVWSEKQGRWLLNEKRLAFHFAREVCRSVNVEEKKEFARARVYGAVEQIAQSMPSFAVTSENWDKDIWLLGVPGAVVDLRTGQMRPAAKEDYISKQTAVAPDFSAGAPIFQKFFDEITQGDNHLQRYVQRIAGYGMTGSTREQKLFFPYGPGGNGKGVLLNTLVAIAGDYAVTATMDVFVAKRGEHHSTDVAMLAGARLVTASETQKGRHWDEALIGRLTGGDPVTARFMRQNNFTYIPQFTLIIVGNHAPSLSSVNEANRRRFRILPFTYQPEQPDEELFDKLKPEWPAILAWAIKGAVDWYECGGLGDVPKVVAEETQDYFESQDDVKSWIDECCLIHGNYSDTSQHLYASYEKWCKENGVHPGSQKELISTLKKQHGCRKDPSHRTMRGLIGIAVKVEYEPDRRTGERQQEDEEDKHGVQ
jgi:putative DNA primase/helicase